MQKLLQVNGKSLSEEECNEWMISIRMNIENDIMKNVQMDNQQICELGIWLVMQFSNRMENGLIDILRIVLSKYGDRLTSFCREIAISVFKSYRSSLEDHWEIVLNLIVPKWVKLNIVAREMEMVFLQDGVKREVKRVTMKWIVSRILAMGDELYLLDKQVCQVLIQILNRDVNIKIQANLVLSMYLASEASVKKRFNKFQSNIYALLMNDDVENEVVHGAEKLCHQQKIPILHQELIVPTIKSIASTVDSNVCKVQEEKTHCAMKESMQAKIEGQISKATSTKVQNLPTNILEIDKIETEHQHQKTFSIKQQEQYTSETDKYAQAEIEDQSHNASVAENQDQSPSPLEKDKAAQGEIDDQVQDTSFHVGQEQSIVWTGNEQAEMKDQSKNIFSAEEQDQSVNSTEMDNFAKVAIKDQRKHTSFTEVQEQSVYSSKCKESTKVEVEKQNTFTTVQHEPLANEENPIENDKSIKVVIEHKTEEAFSNKVENLSEYSTINCNIDKIEIKDQIQKASVVIDQNQPANLSVNDKTTEGEMEHQEQDSAFAEGQKHSPNTSLLDKFAEVETEDQTQHAASIEQHEQSANLFENGKLAKVEMEIQTQSTSFNKGQEQFANPLENVISAEIESEDQSQASSFAQDQKQLKPSADIEGSVRIKVEVQSGDVLSAEYQELSVYPTENCNTAGAEIEDQNQNAFSAIEMEPSVSSTKIEKFAKIEIEDQVQDASSNIVQEHSTSPLDNVNSAETKLRNQVVQDPTPNERQEQSGSPSKNDTQIKLDCRAQDSSIDEAQAQQVRPTEIEEATPVEKECQSHDAFLADKQEESTPRTDIENFAQIKIKSHIPEASSTEAHAQPAHLSENNTSIKVEINDQEQDASSNKVEEDSANLSENVISAETKLVNQVQDTSSANVPKHSSYTPELVQDSQAEMEGQSQNAFVAEKLEQSVPFTEIEESTQIELEDQKQNDSSIEAHEQKVNHFKVEESFRAETKDKSSKKLIPDEELMELPCHVAIHRLNDEAVDRLNKGGERKDKDQDNTIEMPNVPEVMPIESAQHVVSMQETQNRADAQLERPMNLFVKNEEPVLHSKVGIEDHVTDDVNVARDPIIKPIVRNEDDTIQKQKQHAAPRLEILNSLDPTENNVPTGRNVDAVSDSTKPTSSVAEAQEMPQYSTELSKSNVSRNISEAGNNASNFLNKCPAPFVEHIHHEQGNVQTSKEGSKLHIRFKSAFVKKPSPTSAHVLPEPIAAYTCEDHPSLTHYENGNHSQVHTVAPPSSVFENSTFPSSTASNPKVQTSNNFTNHSSTKSLSPPTQHKSSMDPSVTKLQSSSSNNNNPERNTIDNCVFPLTSTTPEAATIKSIASNFASSSIQLGMNMLLSDENVPADEVYKILTTWNEDWHVHRSSVHDTLVHELPFQKTTTPRHLKPTGLKRPGYRNRR